jgi:hypothetical protein
LDQVKDATGGSSFAGADVLPVTEIPGPPELTDRGLVFVLCLDLLATGDAKRTTDAVEAHLMLLRRCPRPPEV